MEQMLSGIGVGDASAWGKSFVLGPKFKVPAEAKSTISTDQELVRLKTAIAEVVDSLAKTAATTDQTTGEILNALVAMLEDPALIEEALVYLADGWNAETSIVRAMRSFTELLA
ncbi:MAG: hypothetical protein KGQ56_02075, partial [Acidobacteria bacterium]|nr:hypothetical protein [Acidobacteriota bacterium]